MPPVPRELLWAIIMSLAIALVAEWPFSSPTPEHAILGIKPGEWLLVVVTWMLWAATSRLVKGADRTAGRQLRAYIYVEKTNFRSLVPQGWEITYRIKNFGQTPAHNVRLFSIAKVVDWANGRPAEISQLNQVETLGSMAPSGEYFEFDEKLEGTASLFEITNGNRAISCGYYCL